ncbi:MAG: glycosyltransferase family 2 protein [Dongiaceae bacterium]
MRLAAITILRDECDVAEAFVRHHAALLDRLYLIDNRSSDGTAEILRRLAAEGLPIVLGRDAELRYYQGRMTTALIAAAQADGPWDCLLPLDADEFLQLEDRGALEAELARLPPAAAGLLMSDQYAPAADDDAAEPDPVLRIRHRAAAVPAQPPHHGKIVVTGRLAALPEMTVGEGNHHLLLAGRRLPERRLAAARVAHFPVRSAEQLVAKVATARLAWLARHDYRPALGAHVALLYERLKENPVPGPADLQDAAFAYLDSYLGPDRRPYRRRLVRQPAMRRGGPLRHLDLARPQALPRILAVAEAMARQLSQAAPAPAAAAS